MTTRAGHIRHVRQGRLGGRVQALNVEHQVEPGGAILSSLTCWEPYTPRVWFRLVILGAKPLIIIDQ